MFESFILQIFPPGGLANSVTTTVWLGVCVTCFFNLRLGWVLSGLVVPGYLVPLLIIKPLSASVIIFEAIITYFIVWFYSEYLSKYGLWNSFFGRDRFFALLLVSIIVRVLFDTIFLPVLGEYITQTWGIIFDYRNNLHSFGLIVVALLANQLWKPGFRKGIIPVFVTIFTTYLLVRYILMELTNFNMGNIVYMYEDIASSMLASPKAYIILLTTSIVASRMNLYYGWDFSGILIPSLLALQWYQPVKLVYTFIETFIILILATFILKLPLFKEANIEGARKTLLFFNIGFFYKLLIGWIIIWFFPEQKITDIYGFGYLLTTLLAIKMHDKDIAIRVTRAIIETSFVAVIAASCIGFFLTYVPNILSLKAQYSVKISKQSQEFHNRPLIDILKQDKVNLFTSMQKNSFIAPLPKEMEIFAQALKKIKTYVKTKENSSLEKSKKLLNLINYSLSIVENHYLYIYENEPRKGWGSYVIDTNYTNRLLIEVPAPLDEWGTLESGTWIFTSFKSMCLAIAGSGLKTNDDGTSNVLENRSTLFSIFQRQFANNNVLQIRGFTKKSLRVLAGQRETSGLNEPKTPAIDSILWVKSSIPSDLDLVLLKKLLSNYKIKWAKSPFNNTLRDSISHGFAELMLNRNNIRNLMVKAPFESVDLPVEVTEKSIVGYLQDWLLKGEKKIAAKGTNLYIPPKFEELLFFDHEILTPLLNIAWQMYSETEWDKEAVHELKTLNASAAVMGYEIIQYHHKTSNQDYLILTEKNNTSLKRFWGTYIFRLGHSENYIVQMPRPLSEINVFEYAVAFFERVKAKVLMISTANPLTNEDGSADVIQIENKQSLYTLVNQVVTRESGKNPLMIVQCRAFGFDVDKPFIDTDAIISFRSGVKLFDHLNPLSTNLINTLKNDRLKLKMVDGSKLTAGYEVGGIPQAMYLDQSINKEFVIIWLSPVIRLYFRQQTENTIQKNQFNALGIESFEDDLFRTINANKKSHYNLPNLYKSQIQDYIKTNDIIILNKILKQWPELNYKRVIDLNSKQSFLLVFKKHDKLINVINLFPRDVNSSTILDPDNINQQAISDYVYKRTSWLEWAQNKNSY